MGAGLFDSNFRIRGAGWDGTSVRNWTTFLIFMAINLLRSQQTHTDQLFLFF
jgi:hypothetical protein